MHLPVSKVHNIETDSVWDSLNLEGILVNFWKSKSLSGWDFLFDQMMAGHGIIKTHLPTYKESSVNLNSDSLSNLLLNCICLVRICSSLAQVVDSRIPKLTVSPKSSALTYI